MQVSPPQVFPTQNRLAETVGVVHWYHPNDSSSLEDCDRALGSIRSRRAERFVLLWFQTAFMSFI